MNRMRARGTVLAGLAAALLAVPAGAADAAPAQPVVPAGAVTLSPAAAGRAEQAAAIRARVALAEKWSGAMADDGDALLAESTCDPLSRKGVVGVPVLNGGAGAVNVHLSAGGQLLRRSTVGLGADAAGDRFGSAVAAFDADLSGCPSLVIGASGAGRTGQAYLVYGAPDGFGKGYPSVTLPLPTAAASGDGVGTAVAVTGSLDGDPAVLYVWVGAPGRDVAGKADAGAIEVYSVTRAMDATAPTVAHVATVTQNSPGVPGSAEAGDRFGEVLAGDLTGVVVGTPREDIGTRKDAGMITALEIQGGAVVGLEGVSQDSPGVPGTAEASDNFGAAVTSFAGYTVVGVPGEDVGATANTGIIHEFMLSFIAPGFDAFPTTDQNSPGVPGANEANDRFGSAVGQLERPLSDEDWTDEIYIGVPGEDLGTATDAGSVVRIAWSTQNDTVTFNSITQGSGGVSGARESGDRLGATIAAGLTFDGTANVLFGVPGEDVGAATNSGLVIGYVPGGSYTAQLTGGAVTSAAYGAVIGFERHAAL